MMKPTLTVVLTALLGACSGEDGTKDPSPQGAGHALEGQHGGHMLEVGAEVAHLEVVHDEAAGTMTIYVLGPDAKTALPVAQPPQLKISTDDGPKVIETKPQEAAGGKSSVFAATDAALKGHVHGGRIAIEINGKVYNPELEHEDH